MRTKPLSREKAVLVGRLVCRHHPHIAAELMRKFVPIQQRPLSLQHIPVWFTLFCRVNNQNPDTLKLQKYEYEAVMLKRIFATAVVYVLDPESLDYTERVKHGIIKAIADTLGTDHGRISKWIREAAIQKNIYSDIRDNMEKTISLINSYNARNNLGAA